MSDNNIGEEVCKYHMKKGDCYDCLAERQEGIESDNATLKAENKSLTSQVAGLVEEIKKMFAEPKQNELHLSRRAHLTRLMVLETAVNNVKSTAQAFEKRVRLDERGKVWREAKRDIPALFSPGTDYCAMKATQAESEATGSK